MIEINWHPSTRQLRQFAAIWLPGFLAGLGGLLLYRTGNMWLAAGVWLPALLVGLIGYAVPAVIRPVFVVWMCAAYPIGWTISHLILAAAYYLVITPTGLIMRLLGRDPMCRKFDHRAETYWVSRMPSEGTARYFRQF